MQTMTKHIRAIAPDSWNMSTRICTTGCPYSEATVVSKSWIENSRHNRRKKPKMIEIPTDKRTPNGADLAAFVVS